MEIAKGVQVDSRTTVRDFAAKSDVINTQVSRLVQGAVVADQEYISDGTVEVKLRMPLYGDLAQVVLPATIERRKEVKEQEKPAAPAPPPATPSAVTPPAPSAAEAPAPAHSSQQPPAPVAPASAVTASPVPPAPAPPVAAPSASPASSTAEIAAPAPAPPAAAPSAPVVYTGMVVDARGIQARPAMSPRIFDEDGKEVYGSANVDREFAVKQGISGYTRDLSAAQSNQRVAANPVTVKALRTSGPGKSDLVISNADAQQIRALAESAAFMKQCRVMIVLD